MKYSFALAALAATAVTATPIKSIVKRAAPTDGDILNYALTLEHLEATLYKEAVANYTEAQFVAAGFAAPFYTNLKTLALDESTHVSFLTSALQAAGAVPVAECTYAFGTTTPAEFVALASVLEGVGVSAYLGAAALISDKTYLTAAGSILTVESRHSSFIRSELSEAPFPQPFDNPLDLDEVFTLAAPFITSCPAGPASSLNLPVKAFPALTLGTTGTITTGTTVTLLTKGYTLKAADGKTPIFASFITVTGPISVAATPVAGGFTAVIPAGIAGQSYVVLTACNDTVNDDTISAGPAIIEIS